MVVKSKGSSPYFREIYRLVNDFSKFGQILWEIKAIFVVIFGWWDRPEVEMDEDEDEAEAGMGLWRLYTFATPVLSISLLKWSFLNGGTTIYGQKWMCNWVFPKIGVPPNHPF